MPLVAIVRHGQASFGAADYDALSAAGRGAVRASSAWSSRRRGLREPEVVAGTLRRQQHTASLLMAAAGYPGPCGTDKRWDEFDHLALLSRYVDPARVEPARQDSRAFQRLLDEALEAWTRDGGWAAFTADALAALQDVAEAAAEGARRGRRQLRRGDRCARRGPPRRARGHRHRAQPGGGQRRDHPRHRRRPGREPPDVQRPRALRGRRRKLLTYRYVPGSRMKRPSSPATARTSRSARCRNRRSPRPPT